MYFKYFSALLVKLHRTVQADFVQEERVGKGGHPKGDIHMDAAALVGFGTILNMLAQMGLAILLTPCRGFTSGDTRMKKSNCHFIE